MARPILSDDLWAVLEPLLPEDLPKPKGGRPRIPNKAVLTGILFILRTGTPWELLPKEMGCGSGMTCWRRLRDWQQAGVLEAMHQALLDKLGELGAIDWSRVAVDSASVPAKRGGGGNLHSQDIVHSSTMMSTIGMQGMTSLKRNR